MLLSYYFLLLGLTLFAKTYDLHGMVSHLKVEFLGYIFLSFFYGFIKKFYDVTTFGTYKVVMMLFKPKLILLPLDTK